ncbi:hypothetical protein BDD12DRAFT_883330 [Trichophaea hybrida]|nr:hypothetical protein BDD12DRAFT_883330 [Trichophaea hybrida]
MLTYTIYSNIAGRDAVPSPVSVNLTDWFGAWLQRNDLTSHPASLRELLTNVLPRTTWVPFAVGDGTYLRYSEDNRHIPRSLRFTIISTPKIQATTLPAGFPADAIVGNFDEIVYNAFHDRVETLCIVGSHGFDSPSAFLQVAGWDTVINQLNFYEHAHDTIGYETTPEAPTTGSEHGPGDTKRRWLYLGSSPDAFAPDTRGKPPFCGHVNGTLVMKELRNPWVHWHSTQYSIRRTFSNQDPILTEELLQPAGRRSALTYLARADRLETIVEIAITAWYRSRQISDFGPSDAPKETAVHIVDWIKHILKTTTVNIVGASVNSEVVIAGEANFRIPHDFFYNIIIRGLLETSVNESLEVSSELYNCSRVKLSLNTLYSRGDGSTARYTPWTVIVPSLEDSEGINNIRRFGLLSVKEIISLLMVDFCNPIFLATRKALDIRPTRISIGGQEI